MTLYLACAEARLPAASSASTRSSFDPTDEVSRGAPDATLPEHCTMPDPVSAQAYAAVAEPCSRKVALLTGDVIWIVGASMSTASRQVLAAELRTVTSTSPSAR